MPENHRAIQVLDVSVLCRDFLKLTSIDSPKLFKRQGRCRRNGKRVSGRFMDDWIRSDYLQAPNSFFHLSSLTAFASSS
ncbi:hypothetical protein MLD38_013539 [Melastoma candidum]|uniref:Uncharacterized protein n=1 Tax=Melastoma candidum TaxID=119954 RepID=A0ACB9R9I7_9MYRT|nr:hypothetical protein MLD38_013539 [Melastoma candidum]